MSVELPLQRFTDLEQPTLTIRNPAGSIRIRGARTSDVEVRGKQSVLRSYWYVIPSMLNCYREGNTITITIDRQWEHDPPVSGIDVTTPFFCLSHIDAFRAINRHAHDKSGPMAVCSIHT